MKPQVIDLISVKGGVGTTTLAYYFSMVSEIYNTPLVLRDYSRAADKSLIVPDETDDLDEDVENLLKVVPDKQVLVARIDSQVMFDQQLAGYSEKHNVPSARQYMILSMTDESLDSVPGFEKVFSVPMYKGHELRMPGLVDPSLETTPAYDIFEAKVANIAKEIIVDPYTKK